MVAFIVRARMLVDVESLLQVFVFRVERGERAPYLHASDEPCEPSRRM